MPNRDNMKSVFELASSQWGLFTAAQALAAGASRTQLSRLAARGRIEPASYGTWRLAEGEETPHASVKAAWLSLRPKKTAYDRLRARPRDAVVAGRTAACMHGDVSFYESPFSFDVASPKRTARGDVELRPWPVDEHDVVIIEGLPVTSVERTVADLVRGREDPSLAGGFVSGVCSRGHVVDEPRLAELLAPLAARNGYPKGDGRSFANEIVSGYAVDAQVRFAAESIARVLAAPVPADELGRKAIELSEAHFEDIDRIGPLDFPEPTAEDFEAMKHTALDMARKRSRSDLADGIESLMLPTAKPAGYTADPAAHKMIRRIAEEVAGIMMPNDGKGAAI